MQNRGLIQIYVGDGKGKTTAAVGSAVRAAGADKKVAFVQFLKSNAGNERKILSKIDNITLFDAPESVPFFFQMNAAQQKDYRIMQNNTFDEAALNASRYDMLILDEVLDTVDLGIIDANKVLSFMRSKPQNLELILTGHRADESFITLADYVSEVRALKHPFDKGVPARLGIEY